MARVKPPIEYIPSVNRYYQRNRPKPGFIAKRELESLLGVRGVSELTEGTLLGEANLSLRLVTDKFIQGDYTLSQWQTKSAEEIKKYYRMAYMVGRGGRNAMDQSDWGRLGAELRAEYKFLNRFAVDIKMSNLTEGQIRQRITLYAQGVQKMYNKAYTKTQGLAGYTEERRNLDPGADHCDDCLAYAALGWQPLGTLPEPGERCQCIHNCKCTKEYRKEQET